MRIINRFQSRVSELPGAVTRARTVRAGQISPSIYTPDMAFEHANVQPGGDPVDALAFAYQFAAQSVMSDDADPMRAPSLGRLYSGSVVREAAVRCGVGALGATETETETVNRCRATFAQTPPEYIDAMTAFVVAVVVRTPGALKERIASLFGSDVYDCLLAVAKADVAAQSPAQNEAFSAQVEPFLAWLYEHAGFKKAADKTYVQDGATRWGWGVVIVMVLWAGSVARHAGDTKKAKVLIERGLQMEDKHQWTPNWKQEWDALIAPWYENPVYLGVGGVAVLAGVWWLSGRK